MMPLFSPGPSSKPNALLELALGTGNSNVVLPEVLGDRKYSTARPCPDLIAIQHRGIQ